MSLPSDVIRPPDALTLRGITKTFGTTRAVDDASLRVRPGTVHALLGENGAGKSTLMRVAYGMIRPDAGDVSLAGTPVHLDSPADAIRRHVGMVHQHFTNVGAMTVAENVALGQRGRFDPAAAIRRVAEIGDRTGLRLDPLARAFDLSVGAQQRLEIVKALGRDARLLILDEPTAVLAPAEAEELLRWLRSYADAGNAVVIITHKLREALSLADDVTVMRRGKVVLSSAAAGLTSDDLATAIVGEGVPPAQDRSAHRVIDSSVAELIDVDLADDTGTIRVRSGSVSVRGGEVLGVAGVEGAGQRELLRALAARLEPVRGRVLLPDDIAFIPEDRHADALVLGFSQTENIALRGAGERRGLMDWGAQASTAVMIAEEFDVRGGEPRQAVGQLSGGNQQKLVLGRELRDDPRLVVAENPTRGLDIRAGAEVVRRLRAAADRGAGVVIYSSDLDEVIALSTRVVVLHAGRVRDVPLERELIGRAMLGLE